MHYILVTLRESGAIQDFLGRGPNFFHFCLLRKFENRAGRKVAQWGGGGGGGGVVSTFFFFGPRKFFNLHPPP